jgi:hypothetical protein
MKPSDFLTELSNDKLTQYKTAAAADASKADKEGDFKEMKRYSDFHKLRTMLVIRFPGFNIPAIPAK